MRKEEIVYKIHGIAREISFMKDSEIAKEIEGNIYSATFDHFTFFTNEEGKCAKYRTMIRIEKTFVERTPVDWEKYWDEELKRQK